jgi:hypothetical protein
MGEVDLSSFSISPKSHATSLADQLMAFLHISFNLGIVF